MKEHPITQIAPTLCSLLGIRSPAHTTCSAIEDVVSDMGHVERLAVVVLDSFGVATWERFLDLTPQFNSLADDRLLYIRALHPPKTPVSFASMMTGTPPEVHNIRERTDPLNVETVFEVASEQGLESAAVGRLNSTVGIMLSKFAKHRYIAPTDEDEELIRLAIKAIKEKIAFILIQLLDIDDACHKFGLNKPETVKAIAQTDERLGGLIYHLKQNGYAFIILADHGVHQSGEIAVHDGTSEDDMVVPLSWGTS